MPIKNNKLTTSDPFVMNEDTVNRAVAEFLISNGFTSVEYLSGTAHGVNVIGEKSGTTIYVESKGSHANLHDADTVFDSGQLKTHAYMQVCKLMEYANSVTQKKILVLANPDIPRISSRIAKIDKSIATLGFIPFWVREDLTVKVKYPEEMEQQLIALNLINP